MSVNTDSVTGTDNSQFLTIVASAGDPQLAADIANAFARAISQTRTQEVIRNIDNTIKELQQQAAAAPSDDPTTQRELADQLQQLKALAASQTTTTRVIEPAFPPSSPVSPQPKRNAALGLVFALLLAGGLIPVLDRLDRRLRDPEDLEGVVGAPTLVMLPESAFPGQASSPSVREAFQTLRAALTYFNMDSSLSTVIVTSPGHAEGKTTVAVGLAQALAQDNRSVILVDGDLRRPQVATRVGSDATFGVEALLLGERSLGQSLIEVPVTGGRLRVLPGGRGTSNAAILLGSARMRTLLNALSERCDMVIVDTPPLLLVSDAIPILEPASGVVLVGRVNQTSKDALRRAVQVISAARGKLLGGVATGTRAGGLYGYASDAYYGGDEEPAPDLSVGRRPSTTSS